MNSWLVACLAFVVSLITPMFWLPLLRRAGVVDVPNARSSHLKVTVRGMGLAPATGVLAALGLLIFTHDGPLLAETVLAISLAVALVGLAEDLSGLSVRMRLGLQMSAALMAGAVLCGLTQAAWWLVAVVALVIAGYVNVANFMDGINGISALHGIVAGVHFAVVGVMQESGWLLLLGMVIAATFIAFIPWNVVRAGVFLGDVGSYLLGALVASTGAAYFLEGGSWFLAVAPAVPYLADTGLTLISRLRRGEPVTQAHRSHAYQRLTQAGGSHVVVAGVVALVTIVCCVSAQIYQLGGFAAGFALLLMTGVVSAYLTAPRLLDRRSPLESVQ